MAEGPRRRWGWEESRCNVRSGCPFFSVVDVEAEILEVLEFFCVLEDVFVTGRKACALYGKVLSSSRRQVLNLPPTFLARRSVRLLPAGLFSPSKADDVDGPSPQSLDTPRCVVSVRLQSCFVAYCAEFVDHLDDVAALVDAVLA